jgi:mycothiol synthase
MGDGVWVEETTPEDLARAEALGQRIVRQLHQLRRSLPLDETTTLVTRPFRPGEDDAAWLEVNNRAFAWHPDQGGWTQEVLDGRLAEPWFDPEGFLLHEVDGRLAGFCWTKVHADEDPPLGEIYVIAVDPDFGGRGLGRDLTIAGLDHLAGRGLTVGMLYVESTNEPALRLYEALGFTPHHTTTLFEAS